MIPLATLTADLHVIATTFGHRVAVVDTKQLHELILLKAAAVIYACGAQCLLQLLSLQFGDLRARKGALVCLNSRHHHVTHTNPSLASLRTC